MHARSGSRCVRWLMGALAVPGVAAGQPCAPEWQGGFLNAPPFTQELRGVAFFDSGNGPELYAAGHFQGVGTQGISGVARWSGSAWTNVGSSPNSGLAGGAGYWIGVLDVGTGPALYVGGQFYSAGGVPARGVARWDGENWSALGNGLNNTVRVLTSFDDGSGPAIYAAGLFTSSAANEALLRGIARWDGAQWGPVGEGLAQKGTPYLPGLQAGTGYALEVFDLGDGPKLYVGGGFTHAGGVPANNIACWDGQEWSALGAGLRVGSIQMMKMAVFDHGEGPQLTVGGNFALSASQAPMPRVARWTGSQWVQVGSDLSANWSDYVNSMVVFPGSAGPTLYIGGVFTGATWLNQVNYVARLVNGDWKTVGGGMGGNVPGSQWVRSLILHDHEGQPSMWAAGSFTLAGDAVANRVARWDGTRWHGIEKNLGLAGGGNAARVFDDGTGEKLYVGGSFRTAGGRVCNSIAAWNGQSWEQVGSGVTTLNGATGQSMPGQVYDLCAYDDGAGEALYAAGQFDHAGGGPCFNIARWDGAYWSSLGGTGPAATARALAVFDEGTGGALYVAGSFMTVGPTPVGAIARWNGAAWSPVGGPGTSGTIYALAVFDEGAGPRLFAGGNFVAVSGVAASGIARWDGAAWTPVGGGFKSPPGIGLQITELASIDLPGASGLYAGGSFESAGAAAARVVARWDGADWHALQMGLGMVPLGGSVASIAAFDDGSGPALYVGGSLTLGTGAKAGLLRYADGAWSLPAGGGILSSTGSHSAAAAVPWTGAGQPGLWVAGSFNSLQGGALGGVPTLNFAVLRGCTPCAADCDGDGALTAADFGCFQSRFVGADPWADCNQDEGLTVSDFACYQGRFAQGCP